MHMHLCPTCGHSCGCETGSDKRESCTHCDDGDDAADDQPLTEPRYFGEQEARNLIGRRVQARLPLSRHWLRDLGLWIGSGSLGTVTRFAFGPERTEFLVGVRWDDPRPSVPRRAACPIDWYTADEYRALLGVPIEAAA